MKNKITEFFKNLTKEKKQLIIIGSLLVIALIILVMFLIANSNKDKYEEYYDTVEADIVKNISSLKAQCINDYLGNDLVFKEKKFETKKMSDYEVLSYIFNYFINNNITDTIDEDTISKLESDLSDNNPYVLYEGKTIREFASRLLNVNWKDTSVTAGEDEIYNFKYNSDEDIYIITPTDNYENYSELLESSTKSVSVTVINSVSTSKTIKTTISVAYTSFITDENNNYYIKYYKDSDLKELVFEVNAADLYILNEDNELIDNPDVDSIDNHKDDFNQYIVTSTKNGNDFSITSIEKK